MTTRLCAFLTDLTLATSGEAASRLASTWNLPVAPETLLAKVMRLPLVESAPPKEFGLDEFAYRRWRVFGTSIVNLQRHCILDLLPDREPATVAMWLKQHPTVQVISRDRAEDFAKAIVLGAPQAIQVLDRFHLMRNLVETLPAILGRCLAEVRHATADTPPPSAEPSPSDPALSAEPWKPLPPRHLRVRREVRHAERTERYHQMRALRDAGMTSDAIGRALGMSPRTVRSQLQHYRADPSVASGPVPLIPMQPTFGNAGKRAFVTGACCGKKLSSKAIRGRCARCITIWPPRGTRVLPSAPRDGDQPCLPLRCSVFPPLSNGRYCAGTRSPNANGSSWHGPRR